MTVFLVGLLILAVLCVILFIIFFDEKRRNRLATPTCRAIGYWDGSERRRDIRIKTFLETKYFINKKPYQKKNSQSKNISIGGILLEMNEKLLPQVMLLMDIFLSNAERPVTAAGEVVWVKELPHNDEAGRRLFDTGIKFTSMKPKDKERLEKHLKEECNKRQNEKP